MLGGSTFILNAASFGSYVLLAVMLRQLTFTSMYSSRHPPGVIVISIR